MSTITIRTVTIRTVTAHPVSFAAASGIDKAMLRVAHGLETMAMRGIERRSRLAYEFIAAADDARRDAASLVHMGLLPR